MRMNKKIFLTLLVVFLLAVGGASYYAITLKDGKHEESIKEDLTDSGDNAIPSLELVKSDEADITDLKTYSNKKYKYELRYPSDWIMDTAYSDSDFTERGNDGKLMGGDTFWENYDWSPEEPSIEPSDHYSLYLIVYRISPEKQLTVDDYLYEQYGYRYAPQDVKLREDFVSSFGIRGRYYETENSDHPVGVKGVITIFKKDNDFYIFKSPRQSKKFHNQILSTFNFIGS